MNSLGENLETGDRVIMQGDGNEESRTVTVTGGFGLKSFTAGTALFVLARGQTTRMDAMEIEKRA